MRIVPHEAFPERHLFSASGPVFLRLVTPLAARPVDQVHHTPVKNRYFLP